VTDSLTLEQLVAWATEHTRDLYDGVAVKHRSCGIALAETFGLSTPAYQALRRGGITGMGECGAIKAGELILGEILGDPDPTGAVTPALRRAVTRYRELWTSELQLADTSIVCNDLTAPHGEFTGLPRHQFCTRLAATTAGCVARVLLEEGAQIQPKPLPDR
jgi:hypothetical protein